MKQRSFPNVKGGSMSRIYAIWKAYAMLVIEAVSAYCRKTEDLPVVVSLGLLLVPMFAADWFARWASLSLYAAIGLPLAWFLEPCFGCSSPTNRSGPAAERKSQQMGESAGFAIKPLKGTG
jgi:hypothetical protein